MFQVTALLNCERREKKERERETKRADRKTERRETSFFSSP